MPPMWSSQKKMCLQSKLCFIFCLLFYPNSEWLNYGNLTNHRDSDLPSSVLTVTVVKRCPDGPSTWEQGNISVQSFQVCLFDEDISHPWFVCVRCSVSLCLYPSLIHDIQFNWFFSLITKSMSNNKDVWLKILRTYSLYYLIESTLYRHSYVSN